MNKKLVQISALFALSFSCAYSQETTNETISENELKEVVVSDSKFAMSKEKSGKIIFKITAKDLERQSGQNVASILSTVVGLEINGNQSFAGSNLSYYIRGARSRQTVVLIDGVPVSDASGINLEYDLRLIPVEQVESIEIMKGAASTLYGSGAAAGVISITLKKASKKTKVNYYFNSATQNNASKVDYTPQEFNQGFSVSSKNNKTNFYTALNTSFLNGISAAIGDNFEQDSFYRVNALVKFGITPTEKLSMDFFTNYDKVKFDFDAGSFADNAENYNTSEQFRFGFSPKIKYAKGEFVLNTSFSTIQRELFLYGGITDYNSRAIALDGFNKYQLIEDLFLVTGVQFQFFDMNIAGQYVAIAKNVAKFTTLDPYATLVYNSKFGLNINAGARLNRHSTYGNHWVYNFNPSYVLKNSSFKIISSFSTAYITPSLYQLYDTDSGNLLLEPEENSTIEAGFETTLLNKKLKITAVGFYRDEKNAIEYYSNPETYEASYFNASSNYNAKGIETTFEFNVNEKLNFQTNYTFSEIEKKAINNSFSEVKSSLYNAKHKINASIDYKISNRISFAAQYQFVDKRDGFSGYPPEIVTLKAYKLLHANVRLQVIPKTMTAFVGVSNILNEDFQEIVGFSTRGRNFKIGLNLQF